MKSHKRKSKASGSTVQKIREILTMSGRYSEKALARKMAHWRKVEVA